MIHNTNLFISTCYATHFIVCSMQKLCMHTFTSNVTQCVKLRVQYRSTEIDGVLLFLSISHQLGTSHNLQVSCRLASPPVIFAIVLASIFLFIFSIISSSSSSRILSALHSYMSPNITTCIIVHSCKIKTELCKEHGATLHYGTDAILLRKSTRDTAGSHNNCSLQFMHSIYKFQYQL